jgi:hypothetical protein
MIFLILFYLLWQQHYNIAIAILKDEKCKTYNTVTLSPTERADMKLWPVPNIDKVEGESLYGFNYAFKKIYENQNPVDCKTAKFIVYSGYESGFGSTIQVEGMLFI